jgi:Kef-type K+ transport system membrane component KefB
MRVVILVALVGFMAAARSFTAEDGLFVGSSSALAVGYLLLTAYFLGSVVSSLGLPKLTGYLLAGILAGGSVLDLVPHEALGNLSIFTGVAVALIALTAGSELNFAAMRPLLRTIRWITLVAVVGGSVAIAGFIFAISPWLPFMHALDLGPRAAFALTLGIVLSAQSPAVVVALRTELEADGPLVRTVLGIVVIADLVVITMFTCASTMAKAALGSPEPLGSIVLHLSWELLGSIVVGLGVGAVLAVYLRRDPTGPGAGGGAGLFVMTVAFIVAEVGHQIALDPLLVALAAGVLVRNATGQGDRLHHAIEGAALPVYLVFFAVAGATIHLGVLAVLGLPALAIVIVRAFVFVAGSRLAARRAGAEETVRRYAGFGLLPQAGLALALSMLMQSTFGELGAQAGALTLGVVALNEMLAPIAYRWAILRAGEAGVAAIPEPVPAVGTQPMEAPAVVEPVDVDPTPPNPMPVLAPHGDDEPWPTPAPTWTPGSAPGD